MERAPLGFCLMLRTPPGTPATHVRPRPGPEHGPGTTLSIFVEPPINVFTHMRATSRRRPVGRRCPLAVLASVGAGLTGARGRGLGLGEQLVEIAMQNPHASQRAERATNPLDPKRIG